MWNKFRVFKVHPIACSLFGLCGLLIYLSFARWFGNWIGGVIYLIVMITLSVSSGYMDEYLNKVRQSQQRCKK